MAEYEGQSSRVEDILRATLGEDVDVPEPQSRVEELLIELKEAIEEGGGGGGPTGKYAKSLLMTIDSSTYVVSAQLYDQNGDALGTEQTIDLPLETMVVSGSYDDQTEKIILTLKNGQTVEFSVAALVSGLQSELSLQNPLNPAFIDWDSTHANVSENEKTAWSNKQNALTFDNAPTENSSNPVKSGGVYNALAGKVDKVQGKGLSTEDYTSDEKSKLAGIAAGAEVNVQADWEQADNTADDYIKGKPTLANVATTGSYNDLNDTPTIPTVPSAYTSTPAMDGVGSAGSSTSWAKGDHVHPSDTSKQSEVLGSWTPGSAIY